MQAIVARVRERLPEIGTELAKRYREEIADYSTLDDEVLFGDVIAISLENLEALLDNLATGEVVRRGQLERFRGSSARRVHQGVALTSVLHAYRVWGQAVWQTILGAARIDRPSEREAALSIAGRIIDHINVVSTTVAQGYLDEAEGVWSDRAVVRRDLLEAVISGKSTSEAVRLEAASLGIELEETYVAVLARRAGAEDDPGRPTSGPRPAMREAFSRMKSELRPASGSLLVGVRHDEVVALHPIDEPAELDELRNACYAVAAAIGDDGFEVGVGGWHPGPEGVSASYAEARDAIEIAARWRIRGRPVMFEDVVLHHVLRSNPRSERLLSDALRPLTEYDAVHRTGLVETLRAYMESGFNVTRSAAMLCAHPNTVIYRLKRIRELTGKDPRNTNDLLLLCLALNMSEPRLESQAAKRRAPQS